MKIGRRMLLLVTFDNIFIWLSIWSSYYLRFDGQIPPSFVVQCIWLGIVSSVITTFCMLSTRLYNRVWQYASIGEMVSIFKAITVSVVIATILLRIMGSHVPISIVLRNYETMLILVGGSRFVWRFVREYLLKYVEGADNALIVGAGDCGLMIAREMMQNSRSTMKPVAFIDDNLSKHGHRLLGLPVVGGRDRIAAAVEQFNIKEIVIAIPSAKRTTISSIIEISKQTKAKLKIIPMLDDLIQGKLNISKMRNVDVEDLLGRDPVKVDLDGIANYVENKVVLVTGAGGSIGSELCRQIAHFQPKLLLLLGHGENSIYTIEMEMRRKFPELAMESVIADVQDRKRMEDVFRQYHPQVIFHAAAHKHVPLMEKNPSEAIKNNVFGTRNVAECADLFEAERFVLISSDKAVNPTSIMGATKRIAEMFIQTLDRTSSTKFVAVRFGNVLGSRGSVIPRFREQIAMGGPVSVTHPEMIRYFMTIPEASQLVIQAGSFAQGGEIFILDMGKPVKIVDLATDLIRLSGFEPHVDIQIEFSGIRPGEKLYEELLTSEEGLASTKHDRIFIGRPSNINQSELEFSMKKLERVLSGEQEPIKEIVKHLVPTYQHVS
jgi:FlaA1/EpsC-like NDP-sugar epimerase